MEHLVKAELLLSYQEYARSEMSALGSCQTAPLAFGEVADEDDGDHDTDANLVATVALLFTINRQGRSARAVVVPPV